MIRTRFEEEGSDYVFEVEMPYPVRVGDQIELDEFGTNWTVAKVTWMLGSEAPAGSRPISMIVVIK